MEIELDKKKWKASPITGHKCFLGKGCDCWWRKDNVSITCGSIVYLPINQLLSQSRPTGGTQTRTA